LKGLPPALRKKKRYIAFRVLSKEKVSAKEIVQEVWQIVLSTYGEWYGNLGLRLELFDEESGEGILRCTREKLDATIAALTLLSEAGGKAIAVKTLGVSGTIKGCKRFLSGSGTNREQQKHIEQERAGAETNENDGQVEETG